MPVCLNFQTRSGAKLSYVSINAKLNCRSVRRSNLRSQSQTPEPSSPDVLLEEKLQKQLAKLYDGHSGVSYTCEVGESALNPTDDADGYDFRLFAKPTKSSDPSVGKRIILKSPTPPSGDPGFVNARRPDTYYFKGAPSDELREQYRQAAISGEQLARGLDVRWVWP